MESLREIVGNAVHLLATEQITVEKAVELVLSEGDSSKHDAKRPNSCRRGYGYAWQQDREDWLKSHPNCVKCGKKGTVVDHKRRKRSGGSDGAANKRTLCQSCHSAHTNKTN